MEAWRREGEGTGQKRTGRENEMTEKGYEGRDEWDE